MANCRCTSPSSRMLVANNDRSVPPERLGGAPLPKCSRPQVPSVDWNAAQSPAPPRLGTTFRVRADLSSRGWVLPLPGRAPAPQPSLSNLGRTAQPALEPVGSRPRQAGEHRGVLGSGEEPSRLPGAEVPVGEGGSGKTDVSGPRCCSPGRPLASVGGSGSELPGIRSGAGSRANQSSSRSIRTSRVRTPATWQQPRQSGAAAGNPEEVRRQVLAKPTAPAPLSGRPGRSPRAATGPCEATGASLASRYLAVRTPELRRVPLPEQRARRALL